MPGRRSRHVLKIVWSATEWPTIEVGKGCCEGLSILQAVGDIGVRVEPYGSQETVQANAAIAFREPWHRTKNEPSWTYDYGGEDVNTFMLKFCPFCGRKVTVQVSPVSCEIQQTLLWLRDKDEDSDADH